MSAISEYVPLLKELHLLMAQGKSDSDEAEAVRDEMDQPWYRMSEEEQHFVDNISADLYLLAGEEIYRNVPDEQRTREWLAPRLQEAHANHDWFTILQLLRNGPDFLTPDQLAWQRGQGYESLGFPEIAVLFYKFVCQHTPELHISLLEAAA